MSNAAPLTLPPVKKRLEPPKAAAPSPNDNPHVVVVSPQELPHHRAAWESLAAAALEPNCFFEPWMLLPALEAFGRDLPLEFALVYRGDPPRAGQLCGFFPLARGRSFRGVPVKLLSLWEYKHCYLCMPLLHRDDARATLGAFFDWIGSRQGGSRQGGSLLEMTLLPADGLFAQALADVLRERTATTFHVDHFTRAVLRPHGAAKEYLAGALPGKHLRDLERKRRRLADLGRLEIRVLERHDDPVPWLEQFLVLETKGWKGARGTALGSTKAKACFFRSVAGDAFALNRLMMIGLFLNDRPVAMTCNFAAEDGVFAFKIAYDEEFEKHSPGIQLVLEVVRRAHRMNLAWFDSCAVPENDMANRLFTERRALQHLAVSTGGWRGNLAVAALAIGRSLVRTWRERGGHASSQEGRR